MQLDRIFFAAYRAVALPARAILPGFVFHSSGFFSTAGIRWLCHSTRMPIMKRGLIAALLGALLYFVWGFVFSVVLPFGPMVFRQTSDEPALARQIAVSISSPGSYSVPGTELMASDPAEYKRRREAGPRATLFVYPKGRPMISLVALLGGFGTMFAATSLMTVLLVLVPTASYARRVLIVLLAGIAGIFLGDLGFPFWYDWPWGLWLASAAFHLSGWLFVALLLAAIVRPPLSEA
jgi:hypothetical protein